MTLCWLQGQEVMELRAELKEVHRLVAAKVSCTAHSRLRPASV